ncbi:MAG: hypothetical protein DRR19_17290 [Candidatus Parabeggiatoa sp. nov. 1]|nr:MAG: hypothetical protein DRR19_17290 [Gammaproteobacteria bacterium]HEC86102.1 radical SAM protein [Thioploca sp.]
MVELSVQTFNEKVNSLIGQTGDFRLTEIWNRCHAHLKPFDEFLPLPDTQYKTCPLCHSDRAIEVVAHLGFGADYWAENGLVRYCCECGEYALPDERYQDYAAQALLWAQHHGCKTDYSQLQRVDARLWWTTPKVLSIEPTTKCNFSCWYCVGRHVKQEDISLEDFAKVLEHFPSLEAVVLVGQGEPIMNQAFFPMVRLAKQRHLRVLSVSNGSTFSTSNVQKICESGIDYISISIDSINPDTFAESRCDGNLQQVLRGIKRLSSYRDEHGYKYPVLGIKGTLFNHTKDQLVDIIQLAKEHGIDILEFFQPLNRKKSYVDIYPEDKKGLVEEFDEVQEIINKGYEMNILPTADDFSACENIPLSKGRPNGLRKNCDEEWMYSLVSGDVIPCCQLTAPVDTNWNLINNPIDSILMDKHYERTRFNLFNGLFPPYCEGCYQTR